MKDAHDFMLLHQPPLRTERFPVYADRTGTNEIWIGSPVVKDATGDGVILSAAGGQIVGVVIAIEKTTVAAGQNRLNTFEDHLNRTDAGYVTIACDPNAMFLARGDATFDALDINAFPYMNHAVSSYRCTLDGDSAAAAVGALTWICHGKYTDPQTGFKYGIVSARLHKYGL